MSEWPTVSIIVLNYNGLKHLQECFASLVALDYPADRLELILVDNASTDGSVAYVQREYPQVRVVRSPENIGFASGNNLGAREATGHYIVFLNNDMWVDPRFVRGLVKAIQSGPDVACASAKILNWDGTQFDFVGTACHFSGHAFQIELHKPYRADQYNTIEPLLFACGGAMMIERQLFLDLEGFDPDYFIYFEDVDLGWRLWVTGHAVVFAPEAVTMHRHHGTMKSFADYRKQMLYKRNALYTVIKNYDDATLGRILPAVLLGTVNGVVEHAIQQGRFAPDEFHIKSTRPSKQPVTLDRLEASTLLAVREVVHHLPRLMEKRRFVQERRRRPDADVAHLFKHPFRFWPDVDVQTQYAVVDAFDIQSLFESLPRRVLVISSDILPYPGLPTVGSGLRAWGLGQGLKSYGHEVLFSMPRAALAGREVSVPQDVGALAWEVDTLGAVVRSADPDVVVVCNWPVLDLLPTDDLQIPVVLDQHGPHHLEREYQQFGSPSDNARRKLAALRKADFFTCAGEKQMAYFQSWLERAGWTEAERREHTAVVPVSLSPALPEPQPDGELTFVFGGIFLPWQDPSAGLSELVKALDRHGRGELHIYGGKHPFIPIDTGLFGPLLKELEHSPRVKVPGMVPHDELIARYTRARLAIDVMRRNPERELAFTTRTVEYLWCGLPVIYHDYAELSDYIRQYNAGWIVNPEDRAALAATFDEILQDPEQIAERGRNAQRLVRERLTWDRTMGPVDRFVRHPRVRSRPLRAPERSRVPRGTRVLWEQARFYYRAGGVKTLTTAGAAWLRRWFKLRVNTLRG